MSTIIAMFRYFGIYCQLPKTRNTIRHSLDLMKIGYIFLDIHVFWPDGSAEVFGVHMLGRLEEAPFHRARASGEGGYPLSDLAPLGFAPKGAGAGRGAEILLLGEGYDLALFAERKRPDDGERILLVAEHRQHARNFAFVEHVHEECLDGVVQVVAESDLVEAVRHGVTDELRPPLGRTPVAVHRSSGLEPSDHRHVDGDVGNIPGFEEGDELGLLAAVAEIRGDVDGAQFIFHWPPAPLGREVAGESRRILTARNGDEYAVALLDHRVAAQGHFDELSDGRYGAFRAKPSRRARSRGAGAARFDLKWSSHRGAPPRLPPWSRRFPPKH